MSRSGRGEQRDSTASQWQEQRQAHQGHTAGGVQTPKNGCQYKGCQRDHVRNWQCQQAQRGADFSYSLTTHPDAQGK